jgi:hypothetical protein
MKARFVVYRDKQIASAADDVAQALAQAKAQGDLLNPCAIVDHVAGIVIIVTGWVPMGQPFELPIPGVDV